MQEYLKLCEGFEWGEKCSHCRIQILDLRIHEFMWQITCSLVLGAGIDCSRLDMLHMIPLSISSNLHGHLDTSASINCDELQAGVQDLQ